MFFKSSTAIPAPTDDTSPPQQFLTPHRQMEQNRPSLPQPLLGLTTAAASTTTPSSVSPVVDSPAETAIPNHVRSDITLYNKNTHLNRLHIDVLEERTNKSADDDNEHINYCRRR